MSPLNEVDKRSSNFITVHRLSLDFPVTLTFPKEASPSFIGFQYRRRDNLECICSIIVLIIAVELIPLNDRTEGPFNK